MRYPRLQALNLGAFAAARVVAAGLLISSLCLVSACDPKPQPGSNTPGTPGASGGGGGGGGAADNTAGGASGAGGGAQAGGGGGTPAPPPCTVELDDAPTGFFNKRLIVTLPKRVELVEQNPFFALVERNNIPSACGATLHFAAAGYMRPRGSIQEVRDQLLEFRGIAPGQITGWEQEADTGGGYTGVYNASASNGAPAVKGVISMRPGSDGAMYFVIYEAEPAVWPQIEPTFRASLADISVR